MFVRYEIKIKLLAMSKAATGFKDPTKAWNNREKFSAEMDLRNQK